MLSTQIKNKCKNRITPEIGSSIATLIPDKPNSFYLALQLAFIMLVYLYCCLSA